MQDILTQVKYKLPVINVVFSNGSFGFIDAEQEDTNKTKFGVDLLEADFAAIAEGMGAKGYTVRRKDELENALDEAKGSKVPVVIDVKIGNARPFPAESMVLDAGIYPPEKVKAFMTRYEVAGMPLLKEIIQEQEERKG